MNQELQQLKDQHTEFGKRITELESKLKKKEKPETIQWMPEYGDSYYTICSGGVIIFNIHEDHPVDFGRISVGNYYKTKEEAERIGFPKFRRQQFEHELQLKIKELNGDWEWKPGIAYWTPFFDINFNIIDWVSYTTSILPGIKLKSNEAGKELKSHFGERLIKYIKGEEL